MGSGLKSKVPNEALGRGFFGVGTLDFRPDPKLLIVLRRPMRPGMIEQ